MVGALKALPLLFIVAGPGFVAGFAGRQLFGWLYASILATIGLITTLNEPDDYDMPGLGLYLFGIGAAVAIVGLLAGVGTRRVRQLRNERRE